MGVAKLSNGGGEYFRDDNLDGSIEYLQKCVSRLRFINQPVAVLGTTGNAAFVNNILGDQVEFFVDENINRLTRFLGKIVVHPSTLDKTTLLILPYAQSGKRIEKRFKATYQARLLVI